LLYLLSSKFCRETEEEGSNQEKQAQISVLCQLKHGAGGSSTVVLVVVSILRAKPRHRAAYNMGCSIGQLKHGAGQGSAAVLVVVSVLRHKRYAAAGRVAALYQNNCCPRCDHR
jgi:hypothetical protein